MYVCLSICLYVCLYVYIHTHIHIYIYIYIYVYIQSWEGDTSRGRIRIASLARRSKEVLKQVLGK